MKRTLMILLLSMAAAIPVSAAQTEEGASWQAREEAEQEAPAQEAGEEGNDGMPEADMDIPGAEEDIPGSNEDIPEGMMDIQKADEDIPR